MERQKVSPMWLSLTNFFSKGREENKSKIFPSWEESKWAMITWDDQY